MRWIWTFTAYLAVLACAAACTSSSGGTPPPTLTPPHTTVAPPTTDPVTSSSTVVGPPHPTRPSIPADVPRTGPNTKPGEKPPLMPLEATQHTPEGAKAFAAFFIKTIDWGYATTTSTYMRHYFARPCDDCRKIGSSLDRDHRLRRHYIGDRYTIPDSNVIYNRPQRSRVVVNIDGTAGVLADQSGKAIRADPAIHIAFGVTCEWRQAHWTVIDLGVVT